MKSTNLVSAYFAMSVINVNGSSECAHSRSALMQGLHTGHARVRDNMFNGYMETLREGDYTVAMMLRDADYKNGMLGKWGPGLHDQ